MNQEIELQLHLSIFDRKARAPAFKLDRRDSRSGKPLLANDPQLASTLPNFWYLSHLSIDGENRVGGSLPGIPGIAVGRTDRIAWGITAGRVDQADIALGDFDGDQTPDVRLDFDGPYTLDGEMFESGGHSIEITALPIRVWPL